jgi:hypothetical protein
MDKNLNDANPNHNVRDIHGTTPSGHRPLSCLGAPILSLLLDCSLLQRRAAARLGPPLTTAPRSSFLGEEWIRARVWTSGMSFVLAQLAVYHLIVVDGCNLTGWWVFDGPRVEGWKWAGTISACPSHCYGPFYFSCDFWMNYVMGLLG